MLHLRDIEHLNLSYERRETLLVEGNLILHHQSLKIKKPLSRKFIPA